MNLSPNGGEGGEGIGCESSTIVHGPDGNTCTIPAGACYCGHPIGSCHPPRFYCLHVEQGSE